MVGACAGTVTVKLLGELALPLGVVTDTFPVVAPAGTVAVIWVALVTVNVAATPFNERAVAPVKLVPPIATEVPTGPAEGWSVEMVGVAGITGDPPESFPPPHDAIVKTSAINAVLDTRWILPIPME